MTVALGSDRLHPTSNAPIDRNEFAGIDSRLPVLLSTVAGLVDVIGFLSLGLFTAHVTGNLVVIAAALVQGVPPNLAQALAVPIFAIEVAFVWVVAKALGRSGAHLARPLLLIQFLLLICVLALSVVFNPAANSHGFMAIVVAMIAVAAMACQFSLMRLAVPGAPSTAVMTGNLTNVVLSLLDTLSSRPLSVGANERLKKTLMVVVGFFVGCITGAATVSFLGAWAWSIPCALAGGAVFCIDVRGPQHPFVQV
jgi:uncharacterized membrane protein YoaK (UPF0700 family)